ncbi:MAG TPA: hypothetical protein EYP85_11045 [Armatimonadetes bacterium]|nr:hypothetical protein [Armatimonadota bacterium]
MAKILLATLGEAHGVITTMVDALADESATGHGHNRPMPEDYVDQVVLLCVNRSETDDILNWLRAQFDPNGYYAQLKGTPIPIEVCTTRDGDLTDQSSNFRFWKMACRKVQELSQSGDELLISLAGGRKSMSALLMAGAFIFAPQSARLYHLIVKFSDPHDDKDFQDYSAFERWSSLDEGDPLRERVIHPPSEARYLIPFPPYLCGLAGCSLQTRVEGLLTREFSSGMPLSELAQQVLIGSPPTITPAEVR